MYKSKYQTIRKLSEEKYLLYLTAVKIDSVIETFSYTFVSVNVL